MGWITKGFFALVGVILLGTAGWWLGLLILVAIAYSLVPKRRKPQQTVVVAPPGYEVQGGQGQAGERRGNSGFEWRWRYALGGIFLLGALFGVAAHGTFSPLVFGGLGALCFLWSPLSRVGLLPSFTYSAVNESTLLRSAVPFSWLSVVELKLSSQESARALSVLHDDLVVVASPDGKTNAYLAVKARAAGYKAAEAKMTERLRRLAGLMALRGVYALPLDSLQVAGRFGPGLEALKMDLRNDTVLEAVGHYPYEVLTVRPDGVHAKSLGAYRLDRRGSDNEVDRVNLRSGGAVKAEAKSERATIPAPRQQFARPPLLWEVISCLQERFRLAEPDGYTMLLNNMHVSRGVAPGEKMRLASGGEATNGSTVLVESLGGAPIEMTRAQLRMVVSMYG